MFRKINIHLRPTQKSALKLYFYLFFTALISFSMFFTYRQVKNLLGKKIIRDIDKQTLISQKTSPQIAQNDIVGDINASYDLLEGWNYIAFPIKPINFTTASGLIKDIINKGGYVTTVSVWDGDRWQEFSQRGLQKFGFNFNIIPGKAYFIKAEKKLTWAIVGEPVQPEELQLYQLNHGWNGVGFITPNQTASTIIDSINQGKENATVIDWWWSGDWDLFIKRYYDTGQIEEYGNDFPILNTRGYMILLNQPTTWRP